MGQQDQKQWWFYGYVKKLYSTIKKSDFKQSLKQDMTYEKLRKAKKSQLLKHSKLLFDSSFYLWICIGRYKE